MAQVRLARVIPSMHVHLCVALWLFLFTRLLFLFVPLLFFRPFQMSSSEFHKRLRFKSLCNFRLGTVATPDHETPLTGRGVIPQTLSVASVTLLDGLALVVLAWQAEPRCIDVKHTQNTLQPSQSASTVVVVLTSAHFVQTAMLSLTSHQLEQHAAGEPRKNAWKNASKEGSLNSWRRCETMLATRKLDNMACGSPMNASSGLLVHGE